MQVILAKILWSIVESMLTKAVASNVLINGLRWWSDSTANVYDDKIVDSMADALGVESKALKVLMQEQA